MKRTIGGIEVEIAKKRIKNLYMRVKPQGVFISAPLRMANAEIDAFVLERLAWIRAHQARFEERVEPSYHSGEVHMLWGQERRLVLQSGRTAAWSEGELLVLRLPGGAMEEKRKTALEAFYKQQVADALPALLQRWCPVLGVREPEFSVRSMSSRWGSCLPQKGKITLNTKLAQLAPKYLEYVTVHELAHLIERGHGERFKRVMDAALPGWADTRKELKRFSAL